MTSAPQARGLPRSGSQRSRSGHESSRRRRAPQLPSVFDRPPRCDSHVACAQARARETRRLRQCADLRNGLNWPRLRAAQREASTANTSRIAGWSSMQQPGRRPSRTGAHLTSRRASAPRRQGSNQVPGVRRGVPRMFLRGSPWGGAPSRLAKSLARHPFYKRSKPTPPHLKPLKPPDYPTAVQSFAARPQVTVLKPPNLPRPRRGRSHWTARSTRFFDVDG